MIQSTSNYLLQRLHNSSHSCRCSDVNFPVSLDHLRCSCRPKHGWAAAELRSWSCFMSVGGKGGCCPAAGRPLVHHLPDKYPPKCINKILYILNQPLVFPNEFVFKDNLATTSLLNLKLRSACEFRPRTREWRVALWELLFIYDNDVGFPRKTYLCLKLQVPDPTRRSPFKVDSSICFGLQRLCFVTGS